MCINVFALGSLAGFDIQLLHVKVHDCLIFYNVGDKGIQNYVKSGPTCLGSLPDLPQQLKG